MLVTVIVSCLMYLRLLGRCFGDLPWTASAIDFVNEWIWCTADCNEFTLFACLATGDVSLDLSLPSIAWRNKWFLIARLMISWRIREMDVALNTDKLKWMIREAQPHVSESGRTQREVRQEQNSCRTRNQYFVAPAPSHIPLRGGECQSERAPAWRENAFWSCVLDRTERDTAVIERQSEKMQEFLTEAEGRPKGAVESRERWTDKLQGSYPK